VVSLYQRTARPETLFGHIFGEGSSACQGHLVTFTGQQARFSRPNARPNELAEIRQRSWSYPDEAQKAADYLISEAASQRDAYIGVHLFREPDTRLAASAAPTVRNLWLDEDEGSFPEDGPRPTAIVASSAERRHLYWRLTQEVTVAWAVAMNRRLATWAAGDIGKAGLATVLRAPGTTNYKRHPHLDPVTMEITAAGEAGGAWEPEVMEQAVPEIPTPQGESRPTSPYDGPELALAEFLSGVEVLGEVPDGLGRKLAIVCPWISQHGGEDRTGTYVGQRSEGGLWFYCNHEHCRGRTWRAFRKAVRARARNRTDTIDLPGYTGPTPEVEIRYE
jgi:hypothetical protein